MWLLRVGSEGCAYICMAWLVCMCDVTLAYVCTSLIQIENGAYVHVRRDSRVCVTSLIQIENGAYMHVWRDSSLCVTWLIRKENGAYMHVWRDSNVCVTWLIRIVGGAYLFIWRDSFTRVIWILRVDSGVYSLVKWLVCVRDVTHSNRQWCVYTCSCDVTHLYVWRNLFICVMWLLRMGSGGYWLAYVCARLTQIEHAWFVYMCDVTSACG